MAERTQRSLGLARFRLEPAFFLILALLICRALANWALWHDGFVAISDDDFARIGIAQQFAHAPSLDPSGTSWLPLPFWLLGSWLMVFGSSLKAAQWCGFAASLLSVGLYWVAVSWFGLKSRAAFVAAFGLSLLPHGLWLGLACVPEGYTAALCLLAIASTLCFTPFQRGAGAIALFAATLCRYETWPIAGVFAGLVLCDVVKKRLPPRAVLFAALPLLGIAGWLLHGALHHHDALFFIARVTQYRQALEAAGPESSTLTSALNYPRLIVTGEPAIALVFLLGLVFHPALKDFLSRYKRVFGFVGVLSLFLIVGEFSHSGATHHLERPLLPIWLMMTVMSTDAWRRIMNDVKRQKPAALVALGSVIVLVPLATRIAHFDPFVVRSEELAIATLAKPLIEAAPGIVAIDTSDYGYLAVCAALDMPGHALPVHTHDPRGDVTRSPHSLDARWLIADAGSPLLANAGGRTVGQSGHFLLQRLPAGAPQ